MFTLTIAPRFYETDALGHVNHTAIPGWLEAAREPIFRLFCPDMDIKKLPLILARIEVDYVAQIYFGRDVSMDTGIEKIGISSFTGFHEIRQNGNCVARGRAVQVYSDHSVQKSGPLPEHYRERLQQHAIASMQEGA